MNASVRKLAQVKKKINAVRKEAVMLLRARDLELYALPEAHRYLQELKNWIADANRGEQQGMCPVPPPRGF